MANFRFGKFYDVKTGEFSGNIAYQVSVRMLYKDEWCAEKRLRKLPPLAEDGFQVMMNKLKQVDRVSA